MGKKQISKKPEVQAGTLLNTGSTLLNLACAGRPLGGILVGKYYLLVGDSASGKTWLSHSFLAEAANNPAFENYKLIYDDPEGGAMMDIAYYFGDELAVRIEPPTEEGPSATVEEFYENVDNVDAPFIYILDSMDVLSTEPEEKKLQKRRKATKEGTSEAGSFGVDKAKLNSVSLRRLMPRLYKTNSILVIISQTRDNLGFGFAKKTRSGGHALRFYAAAEFWLSIREKLKRTVNKKKRTIGINTEIKVKKNRIIGKDRSVFVPIYYSAGIDDTGSCISYLIDEGHWPGGKTIKAEEFDFSGTFEALVECIEGSFKKQRLLKKIVAKVWRDIEEKCAVKRRRRYV